MIDFTLGFMCGVIVIAVLWFANMKQRNTIIIQNKDGETKVIETSVSPKKPDNKAVREFSSDEYKVERDYAERMKAKRARISGA